VAIPEVSSLHKARSLQKVKRNAGWIALRPDHRLEPYRDLSTHIGCGLVVLAPPPYGSGA
jgi:hypothetical protein